MSAARMKHFGWGREGEGLSAEEEAFVMARAEARFGTKLQASASAPALERDQAATRRASPRPLRCPSAPTITTTAPRTPTARDTRTSHAH